MWIAALLITYWMARWIIVCKHQIKIILKQVNGTIYKSWGHFTLTGFKITYPKQEGNESHYSHTNLCMLCTHIREYYYVPHHPSSAEWLDDRCFLSYLWAILNFYYLFFIMSVRCLDWLKPYYLLSKKKIMFLANMRLAVLSLSNKPQKQKSSISLITQSISV